ncbi:MAG: transcription antitermination factor NusB [Lachnospiraceae bacterium]|nr:transcription antitermination factor NusB [Lachnospiraceae bacterium]
MKRSEIREAVFLLLFRAEFNELKDMPEQMQMFFDAEGDDLRVQVSDEDREYIISRATDVCNHMEEIDKMISEKATGWTVQRMGKVDLTVIRLAVYEIVYDEKVPLGVGINEAVELAKKYGRDESGAFVNGVLAKFDE